MIDRQGCWSLGSRSRNDGASQAARIPECRAQRQADHYCRNVGSIGGLGIRPNCRVATVCHQRRDQASLIIAAMVWALCVGWGQRWVCAEMKLIPSPGGMRIELDGQLFTEYLTRSGSKPVLWPIIGPTGKPMTRAYPMAEAPNERKDHVHQRSFWFTHVDVNGISFWDEQGKHGTIVHRRFVKLEAGPKALILTENDWIGPDGTKILQDRRRLAFGAEAEARWIDFDITLTAAYGPVTFGDTKEGTFGIRVAESMKVDAKTGGRIINSEGRTNQDAWGRRAAWVDYHGPVDGQTVGIAVLNHPSSFRFPTFWHVRTYGLFAANPFGRREFPDGGKQDGSYQLPSGQSLRLCYRVLLHMGDHRQGRVAETYRAYAQEARPD